MQGGKRQKAAKCLHLKGAEAGRSMLQPPMPCLRQNRGAEGLGADPGGEVGSVSPLLQAKQLCPRSQLRVAQPLPAGTDGLAEREESFGTLGRPGRSRTTGSCSATPPLPGGGQRAPEDPHIWPLHICAPPAHLVPPFTIPAWLVCLTKAPPRSQTRLIG